MIKFKWVICDSCHGEGSVENPAFENGFTSSEWSEMHSEEQSAYMAGDYNVNCEECKGSGKVQHPDISAMTFGEKRQFIIETREKEEEFRIDQEISREMEAERRFGC